MEEGGGAVRASDFMDENPLKRLAFFFFGRTALLHVIAVPQGLGPVRYSMAGLRSSQSH